MAVTTAVGNGQVEASEGSKKMVISWAALMTAAAALPQQWLGKVQIMHYERECAEDPQINRGRLETFRA